MNLSIPAGEIIDESKIKNQIVVSKEVNSDHSIQQEYINEEERENSQNNILTDQIGDENYSKYLEDRPNIE